MLIITRSRGQRIQINDDIVIHLVKIQGGQVRIGIDAPLDVKIYRQELLVDINEENEKIKKTVAPKKNNLN